MEGSRPAGEHDIAPIVELAVAMRAELAAIRGGALWVEREAWPEPLDDSYRALLARDDTRVVVGTIDDVVLGFGAVVVERLRSGAHLGIVTDLFVDEGAREVGVGEGIIDHLIVFCAERGCVGIDATALPGHRATKNFFEEHHFTARALTMHRRLTPDA
ncbi:MAG: GNAT family N-acetyltransferase [Acidimicrobiia bacterium]